MEKKSAAKKKPAAKQKSAPLANRVERIMNDAEKQALLAQPFLEIIRQIPQVKPIVEFNRVMRTTKEQEVKQALKGRPDIQEKTVYLKEMIESIRKNVEADMIHSLYVQYTQPLYQIFRTAKAFKEAKGSMDFIMRDSNHYPSKEFYEVFMKVWDDENSIDENDLKKFISIVEKEGDKAKLLASALKSENPTISLFTTLFYIEAQYQQLEFLEKTLYELTQPKTITITPNMEKIEWLGSQKQLAELFVVLHAKGWIDKIDSKLLSSYFTKSNTINEVLKPATDKSGKPTYEKIYTKAYKKAFGGISANTSQTKD